MTREYDEDHCWQYDIRLKNYSQDLDDFNLTEEYTRNLVVSDFDFKFLVSQEDKQNLKAFIERHEFLGNLSQYTTHWFAAYHKDILAGVVLFNMPNAFSKLLGEETPNLERLISRGACISWSPKNLASSFIMWCINYMAKNTQYRLFTAYSDPTAKELGTIYQACNFYYLGQKSGTQSRYINPYTGKIVSDRFFRQTSAYKKYAKELGIKWEKEWCNEKGRIDFNGIPDCVADKLRQASRDKQASCEKIMFPSKHKYAYVLGRNKQETKVLRRKFLERNKVYPYPTERGV